MNWPWSRREIVVKHEIDLSPNAVAIIVSLVAAANRRTDAMAQLLPEQQPKPEPPPAEKSPADRAFEEWLAAQDYDPMEKDDIFVMREQRLGRRAATASQLRRAAEVLAKAGVPGV